MHVGLFFNAAKSFSWIHETVFDQVYVYGFAKECEIDFKRIG